MPKKIEFGDCVTTKTPCKNCANSHFIVDTNGVDFWLICTTADCVETKETTEIVDDAHTN